MASALFVTVGLAKAQEVSPVDFMRMNPYQLNSNPATDLPYSSYMSILIGNSSFNLQSSGLRYDNCFVFNGQGKPVALDLNKLANSLSSDNSLNFSMKENFFSLGKKLNTGMLMFSIDMRVNGGLGFNDGLFKLLANGNSAFVGEANQMTANMNLNLNAYQEFSAGYQVNVTNRLSVGGRAKLLFGLANVRTNAFALSLLTDPQSYALRVREEIGMNFSLPGFFTVEDGMLKTAGNLRLGDFFHNVGFGVDLAAEYHITDQIGIVAAANDLGFIRWSANNIQLKGSVNDAGSMYDGGAWQFNGIEINELQRIISDEYYRELFMDTLKQYFQLEFSPAEKYTTMLNTNVLLRGYYDFDSQNRVSLQAQGCFRGNGFSPAATLAYSGSFFGMLDVCATYTAMKGSYTNFGVGLAGNFGVFHIYAATNNILGIFNPLTSSGFNAQAGIVFNLREEDWTRGSHAPGYLR